MASDVATTDGGAPVDVNSVKHTVRVAVLLCLACSVLVSMFAVFLKPVQDEKKTAFRQENVLKAAGLWEDGMDPAAEFESRVQQFVLNLETGEMSDDKELVAKTDPKRDSKKPDFSDVVENDIANIKRREKTTVVYRINANDKDIVVLPVRGYGLWSTLWGFIALDMTDAKDGANAITVRGLAYYDQKETPGLGGEVVNPLWKAKWVGKKAFDNDWNVKIKVTKGAEGLYEVDALSGATITSRGVSNMLTYWLGNEGFGPYLQGMSGAPPSAPDEPDGEHAEGHDEGKSQEKGHE